MMIIVTQMRIILQMLRGSFSHKEVNDNTFFSFLKEDCMQFTIQVKGFSNRYALVLSAVYTNLVAIRIVKFLL